MEFLNGLFNGKGYIDGITIIDCSGEILFTAKFNNKLSGTDLGNYEVVGANFFDVYQNLNAKNSTTIRAMELGVPLYVENQELKSKGKKPIKITSLSIPIKSGSKIVGAIDLSTEFIDEGSVPEATHIDAERFEKNSFENNKVEKLSKDSGAAVYTLENIIAEDPKMLALKEYAAVAAGCDLPVLIYGETGTGKELFAQAVHNAGDRKGKPFIAQNCAAIPDNLLESILFGTSKGAFTGAVDNAGLLELADGGTLFLDEINSMPLHLQSKLLRVLQDGAFRSVGSKQVKRANVKIIAALNEQPLEALHRGSIRKDIYYRLSVMSLEIPPLRERPDDIPLLVNYNIVKYNKVFGTSIEYVSSGLYRKLKQYSWPGNIRELEHIIVYGLSRMNKTKKVLEFADIEHKFNELMQVDSHDQKEACQVEPLREALIHFERERIGKALEQCGYNVTKAAKALDVPRQTLQRKAQSYGFL